MTEKVIDLGPHERMTVKGALTLALRECGSYAHVLIVAVDKESDDLIIRSSAMDRANAAWLAKKAELHCHGLLDD